MLLTLPLMLSLYLDDTNLKLSPSPHRNSPALSPSSPSNSESRAKTDQQYYVHLVSDWLSKVLVPQVQEADYFIFEKGEGWKDLMLNTVV